MERKIYEDLLKWKKEPARKPLLLYGNRQIGKTYTTIEFGFYKRVLYDFTRDSIRCNNYSTFYKFHINNVPMSLVKSH